MSLRKTVLILAMVFGLVAVFAFTTSAEETGKININTASESELTRLTKIGPKTAANIIAYRNEKGLFKQLEDLMNVKGIGPKIYEGLKDQITLGQDEKNAKSDTKKKG